MKKKQPKPRHRSLVRTAIVAIVSIALPLFVLGWMGVVKAVQRGVERQVKQNMTFTLELEKSIDKEKGLKMALDLQQLACIASAHYVSPEEAAKELQEELGEDPTLVLGYNPLFPEIDLRLKAEYMAPDSLKKVDSLVRSLNGVKQFSYQKGMMESVNERMDQISWGLFAVMLVFLLIAVLQINNTTHMMIYAKRFLIRSMTLLGARFCFIRRPFVRRSVWNGFLASLLAIALLALSVWCVSRYTGEDLLAFITTEDMLYIGGALLALGIVLSWLGAIFATNRYIRMDSGKIALS